ncbi:MAG: ligase-associated DNA damage response endonuclease PdeM [Flavobacteriales bacterium]|nr:ligase-associated DNA damage response endonuclease PdeM [Flavobacteriales bacterium]
MLKESEKYDIQGVEWEFFGKKYIWIKSTLTVILSDLHLGKTYHFRKNGFAVPKDLAAKNIRQLHEIIEKHHPRELLILGDLFHSDHNAEWEDFKALRYHYSNTDFVLVRGNHDTFPEEEYKKANMAVYDELDRGQVLFSHEPIDTEQFNVYGHIHPAVRLRGFALKSLRLPCFYISKNEIILPAFGAFTGTHVLKANSRSKVFAIAEGKIFQPKPRSEKKVNASQ